jgi:hypothetical protein
MKKIAKISLVAAIAVAGLTTANAQPLEEAIKGVEVSGSIVYRYQDQNDNDYGIADPGAAGIPPVGQNAANSTSKSSNNYKAALNLSSKVNDDLKAYTRFLVANGDGNFASLDTQNSEDSNVDVELSNVYFGYTGIKNTTVNVGKQGLTTPWTVATQADGEEQTGTGILALSTVGPVTLAGAFFNQTNLGVSGDAKLNGTDVSDQLDGAVDVGTVGAIAAIGPVTVDAWYLDMEDTFDTFTVGAKYAPEVAGIKFDTELRYASLSLDSAVANALTNDKDDNSIIKAVVKADAGLIDGKLAYAKTDKDGGLTALDNDATTTLLGWNLNANGKADADYYQAVLGIDILSNLNLSANYGNIEYKSTNLNGLKVEEEEIYAQLLYKMSKNLSTYVRYGENTKDVDSVETIDQDIGRLQVAYTF